MVESLTRAILNLRPTKFTVGRALVASHSRTAMEQPILRPNFFIPIPRVCKGKERAREIQEFACSHRASHYFVHQKDAARESRHNEWHPDCIPPKCFTSPRPRAPRRPSIHGVRRHTSPSNPLKRFSSAGQRRHASHTTKDTGPPAQPSRSSGSRSNKLFQTINAGGRAFDIDKAFSNYDELKARGEVNSYTMEEVLAFAERITERSEYEYDRIRDLTTLHQCGHRLVGLLEDLEPRISASSHHEFHRQSLVARATAMIGDLQQATRLATLLHSTAVGPQEKDWGVQAYESILLSTHAHFDAIQVLEFLVIEWDQDAMYIMRSSARRNTIRHLVNSILEEIDKPAQVLASRRSWSEVRRKRMSDLLLDALCERGYPECAYALYQEMLKQSISSSEAQRLVLVRALVRADLFEKANNLFTSILVNESRFYLSTALYLFANQGQISRAQEYYTRLEKHGETSLANLAMLLQAHAVHGNVEEVVTLFNRFFPRSPAEALFDAPSEVRTSRVPNNIHYTIVIHAHAVRGDFNGMNAWLEKMCKAGLSPDTHTFTVILKAFARRGDLGSVGVILDQMRASGLKPGCATYTVVLALLAERKDPVAAEGIYKRAVGEGVVPDRRLITSVMHAHVEAGSWRGVIRVFDYLKSVPTRRLRLTIEVYNTLLKAYVLIGAPFRIVSNIFGKLESAHVRPDAHTFALLIQSACDSGLMNVACDLFLEMDKLSEKWESNISINAYVLTIIMSGFLRVGEKARASAIYEDMQKRGIEPTSVTFGNILRAYANVKSEESLAIAEAFLKKLVESSPGERSWAKPAGGRRSALEYVYLPLMNVYSKRGDPDQVERLYRGLLEAGGEPSLGTIVALLDAYRHNGNTEAAVQLWPQIYQLALQQSDINPLFQGESNDKPSIHRQVNILCVPLSIYIDVLSAAGLHGEIYTVWRSLQVQGFAFDSHNWNHLAVALVRAGQPERAFEILEKVILPYQAQSMRLLPTRDDKPPTPLTFDENPPQPNTPASTAPLHHTERRAKMSKASYKALHRSIQHIGEDKSDDFAHPLHILHQISPTWNDWRPHTIVVRILIMVLDHLESGMVVRPVRAGEDKIMATGDTERREANRAAAAEMLARIYENYPQAVSTVGDYEYKFRLQGWPIWPE